MTALTFEDEILLDPLLYARGACNQVPRTWQAKGLDAIARKVTAGEKHIRVHVRTCHTGGKTWFAGLCTHWWQRRTEARTVTTAPTQRQVNNLLWTNIRRIWQQTTPKYRVGVLMGDPELRVDKERGWGAIGFASDRPFNMEGEHSPTAAQLIFDEAKGVPDSVRNGLQGVLHAPYSMLIAASTPWLESDWFARMDLEGGPDIIRIVVTIDDLIADGIPGSEQQKADYLELFGGEDSPEYRSRAMAEYISASPFGEARSAMVDSAMEREPAWCGRRVAALDVARGDAGDTSHDESVIALAQGADVVEIIPFRTRDLVECARRLVAAARDFEADLIRVDANGIGAGPVDIIVAEGWPKSRVEEFVAQSKPYDDSRFENRATEAAWNLIANVNAGRCALPKDTTLRGQVMQIQFTPVAGGKIVVDKTPKFQGARAKSPDRFDAAMMATAPDKLSGGAGLMSWLASERRRANVATA